MQPVIIEGTISIAAATVNDNVLVSDASQRRYLRVPQDFGLGAHGKLLACISATGVRVSLDYGSKNVVADADLRVGTDLRDPLDIVNDDWYPGPGDQLVLRAVNTTGGAITLRYRIVLEPWEDEQLPPDSRVMQRGPVAIANNTLDSQLLDGLRYERPPVPSMLEVYMTASAAGLTKQLFVESQSIAPPSVIPPINAIPQDPFDKVLQAIEVDVDKKIELSVSNTSGGSLNVFWRTKLTEVVRQ